MKARGVWIGIPRNCPRSRRWWSPDTIRSARTASAHSENPVVRLVRANDTEALPRLDNNDELSQHGDRFADARLVPVECLGQHARDFGEDRRRDEEGEIVPGAEADDLERQAAEVQRGHIDVGVNHDAQHYRFVRYSWMSRSTSDSAMRCVRACRVPYAWSE